MPGTCLHLVTPDMVVLWDDGFDGNDFLSAVTARTAGPWGGGFGTTGAPVLLRLADRCPEHGLVGDDRL
ncbi:hypothetical protein ACTU45_13260 [Streptomyces sp. 24-1644]|uniref:hypothetical protein n=1 Tax=Streptomyces sp. 24-1644 TaxID=3457315 RepID=UPI003FA76F4A